MTVTALPHRPLARRPLARRPLARIAAMVFALGALSGCAGIDRVFGGDERGAARQAAPAPQGLTHTVRKGDTVFGLSRRYGVPQDEIRAANQLDGSAIHIGQRLLIPAATRRPDPAPATRRASAAGAARALPQDTAQAAAALGPRRLHRPAPGEIIRPFGEGSGTRKNAGVDIGADPGTPVAAAAEGKVSFVSDPSSPVGAVVLMEHPGGMTTIYGRLDNIVVHVGQQIRAGQQIAQVAPRLGGGSALHFELRYGSDPVNPTPYL